MNIVDGSGRGRRILVFRTGHLGDTIVALPAFHAIRKQFPEAHIGLLTNDARDDVRKVPSLAVLPPEGLFDAYHSYPSAESGGSPRLGLVKLAARLRLKGYDSLYYLMTRSRTLGQIKRDEKFFRICGIGEINGIENLVSALLPERVEAPLPSVGSEGKFLLGIVTGSENDIEEAAGDLLGLTGDEIRAGEKWLGKAGGPSFRDAPLVGVGPGSKWDSKIWAEDRFAETVSELVRTRGAFPVVFGGPEDREKGLRLVQHWGTGGCAAGELGVREAAAVLRSCDLYLGNDTGTMHLAAAAGTRCVAVFAAIDYPGRWEPRGDGHRVFRASVACEGCHTPDCFNGHLCLKEIKVKEVLEACNRILDEAA